MLSPFRRNLFHNIDKNKNHKEYNSKMRPFSYYVWCVKLMAEKRGRRLL